MSCRGFCGHLYLADFGLSLMGARLYDPAFGRFLSPDPYIQAPDNTQNLNRYSYALNNPLKYTDPSGEFWHLLMGAPANAKLRLYGENSQKLFENIFNFGRNLQNGIFEAAGIIKGSHWVNIIGISSYDKISWFGNNVTNHQMLRIWNPIEGVISWITGEQVTNVKVFSF